MWTCPKCGREFKRTNQNHFCGSAPVSIDAYIQEQREDIQPILVELRNAIHHAIPEATETIAWGMPTWKKRNNIIHFAVYKNYIGVYVGEEAVEHFADALARFETHKGTIRLPPDQEVPLTLIADIVAWCYARY